MSNVKVWGSDMDEGTIRQAETASRSPAVSGPIALMPDAHVGIGATVGSVIPTKNAIIPAAVGVDIGCGMIAVQSDLLQEDLPDNLQPLVDLFGRSVPAGVGKRRDLKSRGRTNQAITRRAEEWMGNHPHELGDLQATALQQLGTLGSGNHFLEVCLDTHGRVWVVLHSGSRGVGNKLAMKHIRLAKAQEQGLEDSDLAYFLDGTTEFRDYIGDMLWAQVYALENRELMVTAALSDLFGFVGKGSEVSRINCHHNFAALEEHGGRDIWITRKGAIRAGVGDYGVIPGSMGTSSYIVKGKGNPESYQSASHGAGRRMSRSRAKRELTIDSLTTLMKDKAWNQNPQALLDEHPDAYKDIDQVMREQEDLVEVQEVLSQIVNYKGV